MRPVRIMPVALVLSVVAAERRMVASVPYTFTPLEQVGHLRPSGQLLLAARRVHHHRPAAVAENGLKVGPEYGQPPAPVASEWIQANDPIVQSSPLPDGDWWNVFDDPTLTALVHLAYEQNPNIRAVEPGARGPCRPGDFCRQLPPSVPDVQRVLQPRQPQHEHARHQSTGQNTRARFHIVLKLVLRLQPELGARFMGRIRRNIESSNANLDASVEDYDAALVTLFADVATNYVQYRVNQQRIKIARDNVRIQEGVLALASQKFQVGTTTRLDVEQALHRPGADPLNDTQHSRSCWGRPMTPFALSWAARRGPRGRSGARARRPGSSPIPNTPAWVAAGIPADLLTAGPTLAAPQRTWPRGSAQIGVAEADLYPTIFINGTIGWDAADFSQAFLEQERPGSPHPWLPLERPELWPDPQQCADAGGDPSGDDDATYQNQVLSAGREVQVPLRGYFEVSASSPRTWHGA